MSIKEFKDKEIYLYISMFSLNVSMESYVGES